MSIRATLSSQLETLQKLYDTNEASVHSLQDILSKDILPGLIDELGLNQAQQEALESWLRDTPSVFRICKRHKFTTSFALEALQNTLTWRVSVLPPLDAAPPTPFLRCLPPTAHDPFGRPIVLMRLAELTGTSEALRPIIIRNMELFRLHLESMNAHRGADIGHRPILQYVALLDIKSVSFNNMHNVDLLSWYINELVPRFPGMLAAVFVLNYSWAHSGLWSIAKRTLPSSALCKVFFPSQGELLEYFSPRMIPQDYGGDMSPLSQLDDPLHSYLRPSPESLVLSPTSPASPSSAPPCSIGLVPRHAPAHPASSSRTSATNPFFGYPITYTTSSSSTPALRYGRRRKRDLLCTLVQLWWMRWKVQTTLTLAVFLVALLAYATRGSWRRRWRWRYGNLQALHSVVQTLAIL
ncbi:hypothetical protein EIP91_011864 [Steccherinum ochraceum]|uniref:CRAL-TRIO domain-containing protein n=1 Tax=Steccherinum ochraceum TaxID=92696 RepID=A0A4V2MWX0_9APHY|nr:hypothetical protein EIP91_011864 [Steccherinum ochraceum]